MQLTNFTNWVHFFCKIQFISQSSIIYRPHFYPFLNKALLSNKFILTGKLKCTCALVKKTLSGLVLVPWTKILFFTPELETPKPLIDTMYYYSRLHIRLWCDNISCKRFRYERPARSTFTKSKTILHNVFRRITSNGLVSCNGIFLLWFSSL